VHLSGEREYSSKLKYFLKGINNMMATEAGTAVAAWTTVQ